jgi:catechol 2,3-dioxygenase-like lactoylglutathione lyase family enzyme
MSHHDHLRMPRLSQIGIYTKDIREAMKQYEEVFGIGPWLLSEMETIHCSYRGCETKVKTLISVAYSGRIQLELIQILEGENLYLDTLGGREEGLHHLGFEVSNLEERLQACRRAGVEVLQRGAFKHLGMTFDYAYLDTQDSVGVILEFIQTTFLGLKIRMWPAIATQIARMQKRFGFPR